MFFELATGDFLFDPQTNCGHRGPHCTRDEDHLALMVEQIGHYPPKDWALSGKYSRDFFNNKGRLRHVNKRLRFWDLETELQKSYAFTSRDAADLSDFLLPMLTWLPSSRQSAADALEHPWIQLTDGEVDKPPEPMQSAAQEESSAALKLKPIDERSSTTSTESTTSVDAELRGNSVPTSPDATSVHTR